MLYEHAKKVNQKDCFTSVAYAASGMKCVMQQILSSLFSFFSAMCSFCSLGGLKHRNCTTD